MNVEETLLKLVSINSVSANSNAEIINFLSKRLEDAGFEIKYYPYTDARGVEKINMIATAGNGSSRSEVELALVGHTDTVPFDSGWTSALELTAQDGKLYGRGACDTKGFIAAALAAIEATAVARLQRPLALVLTADEEIGCLGAKHLAEAGVMRARNAIVGEPTSLQPMRAGKGYCLAEIMVRGREGHSAYPSLGASAIFRAARLVSRIESIAEELKSRNVHEAFDPPYTTLNVGIISGGTAKNVLAGECRFTLEWRPVPGQKAELVVEMVRAAIEEERRLETDFDCDINVTRIDEGMETPSDSLLVQFLEEVTSRRAGTIAFGTEAPQMAEMGAQAVVLGPGDIRVAHRTGEFVPAAELHACVHILQRAIERFCL
jgi:acetylornithine deacetylase